MTQPWPLASWKSISRLKCGHDLHPALTRHSKPFPSGNTSSYPYSTTVFDIPHIVSLICDNLTPKDIWSCYRVNSTWCDMFGPHRYRDVRFADLSPSQTWDIIENAHLIKKLKMDLTDGQYFLDEPIASWPSYMTRPLARCINLQELHCTSFEYRCSCYSEKYEECRQHKCYRRFSSVNLICYSPKLQRLTMDLQREHEPESSLLGGRILKSLSELRSLRFLKITGQTEVHQLHGLLSHLPISLEELEIHVYDDFFDAQDPSNTVIPAPDLPHTVIPAPNLRRLILPIYMSWYTIPLLKQSPLLEDVCLPKCRDRLPDLITVLTTHCPRIHSIQLYDRGLLVNSILPAVFDAYKGIRSFRWNPSCYIVPNSPTLATLFSRFVNTLDSLILNTTIYGADSKIGTMLRTFPNLRVVHLGIPYTMDFRRGIGLHHLLYDNNSGPLPSSPSKAQHVPWACRNLEDFRCHIVCLGGPFRDKPSLEKIAWIARQVGQLYQELKALKRLTHLELEWSHCTLGYEQYLLQESALELMVRHGQPEEYLMSRDDLLWMNLQWPTVAEIEEQNSMKGLLQVSGREKSGRSPDTRDSTLEMQIEELTYYWGLWDDWPLQANRKDMNKSKKLYTNQSQSEKHLRLNYRPSPEFHRQNESVDFQYD
ncbi:hypothetical protein BGX27_010227 [Mortierella sp. AM989]|nr:hypothetical protein BGX27_010227 [Mortierella sp. AM989]